MIVLVCGGRTFGMVIVPTDASVADLQLAKMLAAYERVLLVSSLDMQHEADPITLLVHGAAPGADTLADHWAIKRGVPGLAFPADWKQYGKAAGPIRNSKMLLETQPDLVMAFKGGNGTANMVALASRAGVRTVTVAG